MEFIDHIEFYIAYLAPVGEGQHISRLIWLLKLVVNNEQSELLVQDYVFVLQ